MGPRRARSGNEPISRSRRRGRGACRAAPRGSRARALRAAPAQAAGPDGAPIAGPVATTYHLLPAASGPELFERSSDGSGAIVENRWQAEDGLHFYAWVAQSSWEYILPGPGQNGVRKVYIGATRQTAPDGTTRPVGAVHSTRSHAQSCETGH